MSRLYLKDTLSNVNVDAVYGFGGAQAPQPPQLRANKTSYVGSSSSGRPSHTPATNSRPARESFGNTRPQPRRSVAPRASPTTSTQNTDTQEELLARLSKLERQVSNQKVIMSDLLILKNTISRHGNLLEQLRGEISNSQQPKQKLDIPAPTPAPQHLHSAHTTAPSEAGEELEALRDENERLRERLSNMATAMGLVAEDVLDGYPPANAKKTASKQDTTVLGKRKRTSQAAPKATTTKPKAKPRAKPKPKPKARSSGAARTEEEDSPSLPTPHSMQNAGDGTNASFASGFFPDGIVQDEPDADEDIIEGQDEPNRDESILEERDEPGNDDGVLADQDEANDDEGILMGEDAPLDIDMSNDDEPEEASEIQTETLPDYELKAQVTPGPGKDAYVAGAEGEELTAVVEFSDDETTGIPPTSAKPTPVITLPPFISTITAKPQKGKDKTPAQPKQPRKSTPAIRKQQQPYGPDVVRSALSTPMQRSESQSSYDPLDSIEHSEPQPPAKVKRKRGRPAAKKKEPLAEITGQHQNRQLGSSSKKQPSQANTPVEVRDSEEDAQENEFFIAQKPSPRQRKSDIERRDRMAQAVLEEMMGEVL
jgi:hypothetical protein